MTTRLLALIEIDADGSIHVTSGPLYNERSIAQGTIRVLPSWATGPNRREVTLAGNSVRTREVAQGVYDVRHVDSPGTDASRWLFVAALLWIAGEGERP